MFKWLGQQSEKGKQKTRQLGEMGIRITPTLKWLSQRFGKSQKKTGQLQPREFSDDSVEQESAPQMVSSGLLRSLLKTEIADAEQIADSIKMRAQREAEVGAARIIAQAQLEVQEIKGRAEIDAQKRAEDIISAANSKAEIIEVEVKHKALQFLISASEEVEKEIREEYKRAYSRLSSFLQDLMNEGQNIEAELKGKVAKLRESKGFELKDYEALLLGTSEAAVPPIVETLVPVETELKPDIASKKKVKKKPALLEEEAIVKKVKKKPVLLEEEAIVEKVEEPVLLEEEAIVEKVEEPALLEEETIAEKRVEEPTPLRLDSQALYNGEVELTVASPVELKLVSRLYNYLQTIPELKILYTRGSWDQGTTITVVLEKPIPLINLISEIPDVKVTPELLEKGSRATGKSSLPLGGGEKEVKRIKLTMKEA